MNGFVLFWSKVIVNFHELISRARLEENFYIGTIGGNRKHSGTTLLVLCLPEMIFVNNTRLTVNCPYDNTITNVCAFAKITKELAWRDFVGTS